MKLNIGSAHLLMPGFRNMDITPYNATPDCEFVIYDITKGFPEYADESVEAITISHVLFNIEESIYKQIFSEWFRILVKGGIVRLADDNHDQPPDRFAMWNMGRPTVKTLITPVMAKKYFEEAGFKVLEVEPDTTHYKDKSLIQINHGWDKVHNFWMEAIKP